MAIDIHRDLKHYDEIERSKIGIEFFVHNLRLKHTSSEDLRKLQDHFNNRLFPDVEWNQTS